METDERFGNPGCEKYGSFYWVVKLSRGEQYIHADKVVIEQGCLVFYHTDTDGNLKFQNAIFAPGQWLSCYAASQLTGNMIAVHLGG